MGLHGQLQGQLYPFFFYFLLSVFKSKLKIDLKSKYWFRKLLQASQIRIDRETFVVRGGVGVCEFALLLLPPPVKTESLPRVRRDGRRRESNFSWNQTPLLI
jgi:hypothetical protein